MENRRFMELVEKENGFEFYQAFRDDVAYCHTGVERGYGILEYHLDLVYQLAVRVLVILLGGRHLLGIYLYDLSELILP